MLADPKFTPPTSGCVIGVVCPGAMLTVVGDTVTLVGSLLLSVTVTPTAGAAVPSVTGNAVDCPGPIAMPAGKVIVPGATTVTAAVVSSTFGTALA